MKKIYYNIIKIIIGLIMILSFIERLYIITILTAFILLMFVRNIRQWLLTPDKF